MPGSDTAVEAANQVSQTGADRSAPETSNAAQGDELSSIKAQLVEQRRQTTLLRAELHERNEAFELMQVQLDRAQTESLASRNRRKEMARIIGIRDARIKQLTEDVEARYAELAILQRHMVGFSLGRLVKGLFRRR